MLLHEIKLTGNRLFRIFQDEYPINPREDFDQFGHMVCFHKKYNLGDKHNLSIEETMEMPNNEQIVCLPLFLYDHSGITISVKPFSCQWDSSQIGFIYVTKEKIIEEFGAFNEDTKQKAINLMTCEVNTYDDYLTGNVWCFQLVELKECEHCNTVKEIDIDSCSGFYGDIEDIGILDCLDSEDQKEVLKKL